MSTVSSNLVLSKPSAMTSNIACFVAMITWAFAFPIAEVLLESWGTISLAFMRQFLAVVVLLIMWGLIDGWRAIREAPWLRGFGVGGIGFGLGGILFLMGQQLSDAVTPAIAAAMMPIIGALLEVTLDNRKMRLHLVVGMVLALIGGLLATGVGLSDGNFGPGAGLCFTAVILFAWATRSTTRDFPKLSTIGQTTITLAGGMFFLMIVFFVSTVFDLEDAKIGQVDHWHIGLIIFTAVASMAFSHLLWIWGAGSLGIMLASFHMNAVPFYVMVIVLLMLDGEWNWMQAAGAALVAAGVIISQTLGRSKKVI